jgi:carbon storage regulator
MLILRRKVGEKIVIGEGITVVVNRVSGGRVTLGIEAPNDVHIVRGELRAFDDPRHKPSAPVLVNRIADLPVGPLHPESSRTPR